MKQTKRVATQLCFFLIFLANKFLFLILISIKKFSLYKFCKLIIFIHKSYGVNRLLLHYVSLLTIELS